MGINVNRAVETRRGIRMASSPNLDDIARILDLIAAPLALEVLDGLGNDALPEESVPPGTDAAVIDAAIESLRVAGAVTPARASSGSPSPALTPLGRRLLEAFQRASEIDHPKIG